MADNLDELEFQLTDADREELKQNSAFSLPDNPSDKEFSASQIKRAMYYPSLMLFDWMKEGFDGFDEKFEEYDEKLEAKVDKLDTESIVYGTDGSKTNVGIQYSINVVNSAIPQRNNIGEINVPLSTTNASAAISYSQFNTEISRLDSEDVKKAGSTMSGNLKFENGFGIYDGSNKILISQFNSVNTVGNSDSELDLKGNAIKTVDKTMQKYNSATGTSENYALISDVNTETSRAMAEEAEIRNIASGKSKSISISIADNPDFDTETQELVYTGTIKDVDGVVYNQSDLKKGDEILIVETNKKDRWFGGTNRFFILESDTSFLVNYQKKLSNSDGTVIIDHTLGTIRADISFTKLTGEVSDNSKLTAAFALKQDKATSYNFNGDTTKTVFYQAVAPAKAPTGALWMFKNAAASVKFSDINGSIADNVTSDTYIKDLIKSKVNRGVITTLEPVYNGDVVQLKYTSVNLWEQTSSSNTFNLNLANPTTAGLMSFEDYNTLLANTQKIAQLEGRLKRISYEVKDNPTANEIDAFVRGLGYVEADFPYLKVIVYGTKHMWLYYTRPTARWQDDGVDAAGIFTNDVAGIIKGSATNGKVYAESDGTGSVYGWDALNTTVINHTSQIATIQASLGDYLPLAGGTMTGNIAMAGHLINMSGGRIGNVAIGGDDDAVPKKWINSQLSGKLDKISSGNVVYATLNGAQSSIAYSDIAGSISSIMVTDASGELAVKNNPTANTSAVNKGYVDPQFLTLTNNLSAEVNSRIENDNDIMYRASRNPTTTDVGVLGQLWRNTSTGGLYQCKKIVGNVYTWKEFSGGSGFELINLNTTDESGTITGEDFEKLKASPRGVIFKKQTNESGEDENDIYLMICGYNYDSEESKHYYAYNAFIEGVATILAVSFGDSDTSATWQYEQSDEYAKRSNLPIDDASIKYGDDGNIKVSYGGGISSVERYVCEESSITSQTEAGLFKINDLEEGSKFGAGVKGGLEIIKEDGTGISIDDLETASYSIEIGGETKTLVGFYYEDGEYGNDVYIGYIDDEEDLYIFDQNNAHGFNNNTIASVWYLEESISTIDGRVLPINSTNFGIIDGLLTAKPDDSLSNTSTNFVQNKPVKDALDLINGKISGNASTSNLLQSASDVSASLANYLLLSGGTLTGKVIMNAEQANIRLNTTKATTGTSSISFGVKDVERPYLVLSYDQDTNKGILGFKSTSGSSYLDGAQVILKPNGDVILHGTDSSGLNEKEFKINSTGAELNTSLTMSDAIIASVDTILKRSVDNSYIQILGGTDNTGSRVNIYGKSHSNAGEIEFIADDGTNETELSLNPNAVFSWGGSQLYGKAITNATKATLYALVNSGATMSFHKVQFASSDAPASLTNPFSVTVYKTSAKYGFILAHNEKTNGMYKCFLNGSTTWSDWVSYVSSSVGETIGGTLQPVYLNAGVLTAGTALYNKNMVVNGTNYGHIRTTNNNSFTIFAPTTAGTANQIAISAGSGAPVWSSLQTTLATPSKSTTGTFELSESYSNFTFILLLGHQTTNDEYVTLLIPTTMINSTRKWYLNANDPGAYRSCTVVFTATTTVNIAGCTNFQVDKVYGILKKSA